MIALYRYENGRSGVVYSYDELHTATFEPSEYDLLILDGSHGKTYKERKASIEEQAIDYSYMFDIPRSWYDIMNIGDYFTTYGKRYGLMEDFKENAIC